MKRLLRINWKSIFWMLVLGAFTAQASLLMGQTGSFSVLLDTTEILIGEQTQITLTYTGKAQDTVVWPQPKDTFTKEIEIVNAHKIDTTYSDEDITQRSISQVFTITSFDSGYWVIPPMLLAVNGSWVESEPVLLSVNTVDVENPQEIKDIKGNIEVELSLWDYFLAYWWILLIVIGVAIFIWWMIHYTKTLKKSDTVYNAPVVVKPAHETALEKLNALKEAGLWQKGKIKEYYVELSYIFREYLEHRYGIEALESTTREILGRLDTTPFPIEETTPLNKFLLNCDMAKYAKSKPMAVENEAAIDFAFKIVELTKAKPKTDVPENEGSNTTNNQQNLPPA